MINLVQCHSTSCNILITMAQCKWARSSSSMSIEVASSSVLETLFYTRLSSWMLNATPSPFFLLYSSILPHSLFLSCIPLISLFLSEVITRASFWNQNPKSLCDDDVNNWLFVCQITEGDHFFKATILDVSMNLERCYAKRSKGLLNSIQIPRHLWSD